MPSVFLSHSSHDKPTVARIAEDLKAKGIDVWLDAEQILAGQSFVAKIEQGLDDSDFIALFLSRHAVDSGWVAKEWQSRLSDEIQSGAVHIIPARLDDCAIPRLLRDKHYADFAGDYDAGLRTLMAAILQQRPPQPPRPEPYEARLVVSGKDGGAEARWHLPGDQDERDPFPLALPLAGDDLDALRWYLETYVQFAGHGDRARAAQLEQRLEGWGRALHGALFDNAGGGVALERLREAVERGRPTVITLASETPEVLGQPWEMLRDSRGPLTFQGVTLRRQLRKRGQARAPVLELPLRVLLIVSRPSDTGFIDPRNSIAPMLDALDDLGPGQLRLDFCEPPTFPQLERQLREARRQRAPYHIVHFDGHGTYLPRTGIGALCFENPDQETDLVPAPRLGDLMVAQGVPLALLEACRGADLSDRPVFGSLAPALLASGVGSVVAFSHSVHVEAARLLVERFYEELAKGASVGEALAEGRRALQAKPARWLHYGSDAETIDLQDWFIPQLYQVGADPTLTMGLAVPQAGAPTRSIGERLHGFPPEPPYRFHGRARELLELERAFRRFNGVLLHAMGGMGKTALAREAALWWLRTGRFEQAVFVSFEQWAGAPQVAQRLGLALEGDGFASRSDEDQWRDAVRLFHERRVLLVWDNFESTLPVFQQESGDAAAGGGHAATGHTSTGAAGAAAPPGLAEAPGPAPAPGDAGSPSVYTAQARAELARLFRELTQGAAAGRLIVTCRPEQTGLVGIKEIALQGLARPDSLHLLAAVLDTKGIDTERPGYERAATDRLLEALADHPLSIALVAPHLAEHTPGEIQAEFAELITHFADGTATESRNSSLLASLEFSKRRLSAAARAVLPYLAWFQGGVFEEYLILFAELEPARWQAARAELEATALLRVESHDWATTPFLRFHPTLPFATRPEDVPDPAAAEGRFISVYLAVMRLVDEALRGSLPSAAMSLMALEEANVRAAMRRAFARGYGLLGIALAETLQNFLGRAGRPRERDELVAWVRQRMPNQEALDAATCLVTRDDAWGHLTRGHAAEAITIVGDLIRRLEKEGLANGGDPTYQIAASRLILGRMLLYAGRPDQAVAPLNQAIIRFEELGEASRDELAAALSNRAVALKMLGRLDEALESAKRGLAIRHDVRNDRDLAEELGQTAQILMEQHRYTEADALHDEALQAAVAASDMELQGSLIQSQAILKDELGHHDRAIALHRQALDLFRSSGNTVGEMQTTDLLGSAELQRGQLDAAEAWFARARKLAERLKDRRQLAATAQNVGLLHQTRAEQAENPVERERCLRQAVHSVEQSLAIELELNNRPGAAASHFQLGRIYLLLGELDEAARNAREALAIDQALNLPDVWKDYHTLAEIARARGDEAAAAQWQAKRDAKRAELERLRRGDGQGAGVPEEVVKAVTALALAAYQARGGALPPEAAEALAQMAAAPAPFAAIGAFLRAVAAGEAPPPPTGLPPELQEILDALAQAIR